MRHRNFSGLCVAMVLTTLATGAFAQLRGTSGHSLGSVPLYGPLTRSQHDAIHAVQNNASYNQNVKNGIISIIHNQVIPKPHRELILVHPASDVEAKYHINIVNHLIDESNNIIDDKDKHRYKRSSTKAFEHHSGINTSHFDSYVVASDRNPTKSSTDRARRSTFRHHIDTIKREFSIEIKVPKGLEKVDKLKKDHEKNASTHHNPTVQIHHDLVTPQANQTSVLSSTFPGYLGANLPNRNFNHALNTATNLLANTSLPTRTLSNSNNTTVVQQNNHGYKAQHHHIERNGIQHISDVDPSRIRVSANGDNIEIKAVTSMGHEQPVVVHKSFLAGNRHVNLIEDIYINNPPLIHNSQITLRYSPVVGPPKPITTLPPAVRTAPPPPTPYNFQFNRLNELDE